MCTQPHHPATCITKTDPARLDGTEGEVTGCRAATKFPASKFNYILTVWKLQKCWPLGEFDGMQSHCIEYVLLLYTALRLVWGLNRKSASKRLFCRQFSISVSAARGWCVPSWRSQSSSQRRSLASPGTSFIHVSDLFFAAMASQDSHCIYYRGVMKIEFVWRSPTCIVWLGCNAKVSSLHCSCLHPQLPKLR